MSRLCTSTAAKAVSKRLLYQRTDAETASTAAAGAAVHSLVHTAGRTAGRRHRGPPRSPAAYPMSSCCCTCSCSRLFDMRPAAASTGEGAVMVMESPTYGPISRSCPNKLRPGTMKGPEPAQMLCGRQDSQQHTGLRPNYLHFGPSEGVRQTVTALQSYLANQSDFRGTQAAQLGW